MRQSTKPLCMFKNCPMIIIGQLLLYLLFIEKNENTTDNKGEIFQEHCYIMICPSKTVTASPEINTLSSKSSVLIVPVLRED